MIVIWWVVSSLLGLLALPIAFRIFGRLPDRGIAFARVLGLMFASYVLWLGASLGFVPGTLGGALGAVLILALVAYLVGDRAELRAWLRDNLRLLGTMEIVFAAAFLAWAFVRANNPEIQFTEKPMEMAFINGILRSETFPPIDPWLSGYGISYYYFGYVMIALLTQLTRAAPEVAFNLANALWFGLVAAGSYSILYNLLLSRRGSGRAAHDRLAALLAPFFVLITGNLEAVLDVAHSRHWLWEQAADGSMRSGFWSWLNIKQLAAPPAAEPTWIPDRHLWWWRASRVINDVDLAGVSPEVIDEFPMFAFLLADNHPHLLAIPVALMAISLALQVIMRQEGGERVFRTSSITRDQLTTAAMWGGIASSAIVGVHTLLTATQLTFGELVSQAATELVLINGGLLVIGLLAAVLLGALPIALTRDEFVVGAWVFGGLAFLNTWDAPIYILLLLGAAAWINRHLNWRELVTLLLLTGTAVGIAAIALYLPWYPSFASQAGGLLPNLIFPTRFIHLLVMFGVALVPIFAWLVWRASRGGVDWKLVAVVTVGLPLAILLLSLPIAGATALRLTADPTALESVLRGQGVGDLGVQEGLRLVLSEGAVRRLATALTPIVLGLVAGLGIGLLAKGLRMRDPGMAWPFVALLIVVGALLVLTPEFVYLRDLFGTRMNTVFKLYFAAWILWGLAAAFATIDIWRTASKPLGALVAVPLMLGLVYPALATWTKTNGFQPINGRTLDGARFLAVARPEDYEAIQWINHTLPTGVLAEAVGGSYSEFGRVATLTGLPSVLNWGGHQIQWRGDAAPQGSRESDVRTLYETRDWFTAQEILDRYDIDYVYVGPLEFDSYTGLVESKFAQNMRQIYSNGGVRIYSRAASG